MSDTTPAAPLNYRKLGAALEFLRLLWAINHGIATRSLHTGSHRGVSARQWMIVHVVSRFPGISASELASILHLHPSSLTGVLQLMKRNGLLLHEANPRDRRRLQIQVTAKGQQLYESGAGSIEVAVVRTLSSIEPAKLKATRHVLTRLADNLQQQRAAAEGEQPQARQRGPRSGSATRS